MKFNKNVGFADRMFRLVSSLMMMYFGFINDNVIADQVAAILLGVFGIIIFLTAIFCLCPLYNLIGINTTDTHNKNSSFK